MPGPIQTKVIGAFRSGKEVQMRSLRTLAETPSPKRETVEVRILEAFDAYTEKIRVVRLSPTKNAISAAIKSTQEEIGRMILYLNDPVPKLQHRNADSDQGERTAHFHSALDDILRSRGYKIGNYKYAAASALEAIYDYGRIATELNAAVEKSVDDGLFVELSEKPLRQQLFRTLLRILADEGLEVAAGAKSLIATLVMELEDISFAPADIQTELSYRKELARQIKTAVNDQKGV